MGYLKKEQEEIELAYAQMIEEVALNMSNKQRDLIHQAYDLALKSYDGKRMYSGKPYILHLIELAKIAVKEIGLSAPSVISALLHGIDYKTNYDIEKIKEQFGQDVATIITGFNQVSNIRTERLSFQSDKFRKLFLSLVDDIRVVLIKIAHRLYDLRNQNDINPNDLRIFVSEVKHLYAPITHRLGLYKIKSEFEEYVMLYENPEKFEEIRKYIKATESKQKELMKDFIVPIERELVAQKMNVSIKWRTKSIPSIYAKMQEQNVGIEQVYDIFAARIIIHDSALKREKEDCWRVYSVVSDLYQPDPVRLRDWITTPKASGYESLHTTVKYESRWVEVQIRTERMDEIAEKGQAAHWQYKEKTHHQVSEEWLNQIRSILENPNRPFSTAQYLNKYQTDKIFIFTPQGDLKQLPKSSTVLDFAYGVHTRIGDTCSGARVNNKAVPIRYELKNGDKVEIITNKKQTPKSDWLNFVTTDRARSKIKRFLKEEQLKEAELGRGILHRKLKNWKINFNDQTINLLLKEFKFENAIELYHKIATEEILLTDIKHLLLSHEETEVKTEKIEEVSDSKKTSETYENEDFLLIDNDLKNVNYKLAKCCSPIPGDDVLGFVTVGQGIAIHRKECPNAVHMLEKYSYRLINVKWRETESSGSFQATLRVTGEDSLGLMGEITNVVAQEKMNMCSITFNTRDGFFDGKLVLQIASNKHLEQIVPKILRLRGVAKVQRIH
jgi:GTP pyrophosphokinase